jgi:hypothetical protein
VIRQAKTSVLVYKPARKTTAKNDEGQLLTRISK